MKELDAFLRDGLGKFLLMIKGHLRVEPRLAGLKQYPRQRSRGDDVLLQPVGNVSGASVDGQRCRNFKCRFKIFGWDRVHFEGAVSVAPRIGFAFSGKLWPEISGHGVKIPIAIVPDAEDGAGFRMGRRHKRVSALAGNHIELDEGAPPDQRILKEFLDGPADAVQYERHGAQRGLRRYKWRKIAQRSHYELGML